MYEYSKNNHYKWGWGTNDSEWFNEADYTQPFKVTFAPCSRPHKSFREECVEAVKLIANQSSKHIYVGLSGGSDSQVVCLALREAKIPFTPCIIAMSDSLNHHDVANAVEFCKKFNFRPVTYRINLLQFYQTQAKEWMLKYNISNGRTILQLWLQQFVSDGVFIMAGGDVQLNRYLIDPFDKTKQSELGWRHKPTPILQHLINNNLEGTTKFFMYTPELIASIINSDIMKQFAEVQDSVYSSTYIGRKNFWQIYNNIPKQMLYKYNWPEMNIVPKYHGFENAEQKKEVATALANINSQMSVLNSDKVVHINYSELSEYLTFKEGKPQKIWYSNVTNRSIAGEDIW